MEHFTAYHVVTERPMTQGQQIRIDRSFQSGVFRRVMEKLPLVEKIYAHPDQFPDSLEHHTHVALRELALEEVRQNQFPDYPSRLHCLYVSESLSEAKQWAKYFASLGRPTYHIVRLEIDGRRFTGDAALCFDGVPDRAANLALAERYWCAASQSNSPIREILVDGHLTVAEIVQEIQANIP